MMKLQSCFVLFCTLTFPKQVSSFDKEEKPSGVRVEACGISSNQNWVNWMESVDTEFPLVYPKTEEELRTIVLAANDGGCKVRPAGTGHSYSGMVTNKVEDSDVIVVNPADYLPPPEWHFVLDEARSRVRMSAGATLVDLQRFLLLKGYRLPVVTGGPNFALGGVYLSPSVHGNAIEEDRCTSLLTGVRAMIGNGTIIEVEENNGIKDWRGSMGLLGVVLAMELRVERFNGLSLSRRTVKFGKSWSRENFQRQLLRETRRKDYFAMFYKYSGNEALFFTGYVDGRPENFNLDAALEFYNDIKASVPDLAKTGGGKLPDAALVAIDALPDGDIVTEFYWKLQETSYDAAIKNPADGYTIFPDGPGAPALEVHGSVLCPSDCITDGTIYELIEVSRLHFDQVADATFPRVQFEVRLFTVEENMMTLEHLQPGRYVALSMTDIRVPGKTVQSVQEKLAALQQVWDDYSGSTMLGHHGKHYGNGPVGELDSVFPYQDEEFANRFYSSGVRSDFINLMLMYDPNRIFAAGEGAFLLGISSNKFEPRKLNFETSTATDTECKAEGAAECISGCCNMDSKDGLLQCSAGC